MISKRIFDVVISFTGLILFLPVYLIIIVAIKIQMPGSIFFKQLRVGRAGYEFKLYKFRTMHEIPQTRNERFDAGDISRVTLLGKKLRKYKLDELPQLYNVLIGDMSLVGPRPEIKQWTEVYPDKWSVVLTVRPGITDNASITFRDEEELLMQSINPLETYQYVILPRKLDMYISYVNKHTFFNDIYIILKTFLTVIIR